MHVYVPTQICIPTHIHTTTHKTIPIELQTHLPMPTTISTDTEAYTCTYTIS